MNTETSEPPTTIQREASVLGERDRPATQERSLGKFLFRLIVVVAGVLIGGFVAVYLGLILGWIGC